MIDAIQNVMDQFPEITSLEEASFSIKYLSILIGGLSALLVGKGVITKDDLDALFIMSLHLCLTKGTPHEVH